MRKRHFTYRSDYVPATDGNHVNPSYIGVKFREQQVCSARQTMFVALMFGIITVVHNGQRKKGTFDGHRTPRRSITKPLTRVGKINW